MKINLYSFIIFCAGFLIGCDQKSSNSNEATSGITSKKAASKENAAESTISQIPLYSLDGEPLNLEKFAGKTIFLNFWATWCKPCLKEMPSIERAKEQLTAKGFVFLAASDEDPKKIKEFKEANTYTLQFVHLKAKFPDLGIYSLPTTFIIDANGAVVMKKAGAVEWDQPEIIEKLEDIAGSDD